MTHSSFRPSWITGFVLALCASFLIAIQPWEADAKSAKKQKFSVECVGSVALIFQGEKFLDSAVVGSLGCDNLKAAAK